MIVKSPEKHLTDQEFYTHSRFFDWIIEKKQLDEEEDIFSIRDLTVGNDETGTIFNRIFMSAQILDLSISVHHGYKFDEEITNAKIEAEKKLEKEKSSILKIIKNIEDNKKIKITDVATVSWVWYEIYDHIRFTPSDYKVHEKMETIHRMEMDKYLDNFINNRLAIAKKNYYAFETQKKALINLIDEDKKITLYGNNFIVREKVDEKCVYERLPDFCLIQTVYALQKLGYLKVVNVWEDIKHKEGGSWDSKPIRHINTNIILNQTFIDEINNKYKKDNPKNVFEKFDAKKGTLKFAGKEIDLAKKGKETDAVLLMKTLLKSKSDEWMHNDEILSDWGYNDDDQKDTPKNKVYFAGQKINNAVALKTQIDDFVECNTTKARINPKYRKVDE